MKKIVINGCYGGNLKIEEYDDSEWVAEVYRTWR